MTSELFLILIVLVLIFNRLDEGKL